MKQKAKIYKGKRIVIGDKNLITKNEIHVNDIPQEGGESGGGESGGGVLPTASKNDVNFRDYDGTILYSYTKDEFLALNELPSLPTREGLICQEWNWSIDSAKEYVSEYGVLEVGATYITDDGKTRLYIRIAAEGRMDVPLYFSQSVANGVTIDWGDGSTTETLDGTGNVETTHHYDSVGHYIISLDVGNECELSLGHNSNYDTVLGNVWNSYTVYSNMLQKVEIGKGVTNIQEHSFYECHSLISVVLPKGIKTIGANSFNYCCSLISVVIPQDLTSIGSYAFNSCSSLASLVLPQNRMGMSANTFKSCNSLTSLVLPPQSNLGLYNFEYCYALASIVLPQGLSNLRECCFSYCLSLASIAFPQNLSYIDTKAFQSCKGMAFYDFRKVTWIPNLSNKDAFTDIPSDCKIVVPDELYDTWIKATNWSTYASKIIKASEFNA